MHAVVLDHASAPHLTYYLVNLCIGAKLDQCLGPENCIGNFTFQVTMGFKCCIFTALSSIASCRPEAMTTVSNRKDDWICP